MWHHICFCCKVHRSFSGRNQITRPHLNVSEPKNKNRGSSSPPLFFFFFFCLRSGSASQEVPVKVKLQPAPESFLTRHKSVVLQVGQVNHVTLRNKPTGIKMLSLHVIAAWENKWPTLPQLDFTTVSCHDIDTLCNIWEAVYRWTEVAWVGALIQNKIFFNLK